MLAQSVHQDHRNQFMAAMGPNSVALIASPPERLRNGDTLFSYRQGSDLYYLTGFAEPEATVVLRPDADEKFVLFVRPRDPDREIWDGRRAGLEGARSDFGADQSYSSIDLKKELKKLISNIDDLYYELGVNEDFDKLLIGLLVELRQGERRGLRPPKRIVDPRFNLHELRLHKNSAEVDALRRAAEITREAHVACMRRAKPGVGENEIEALIEYTFRRRGGTGPGYTSIVGGGANATILHYIENDAPLRDGDMLLIDAGCEFGFYTADVTRTFPVNGRFTETQRKCYELVLDAQTQAIEMTRPGVTIDQIHDRCVEILTAGMISIGLLEGSVEERIKDGSYKRFYMHRTSHWLGLDVHDVGPYTVAGEARPLRPGMVITIEPGLYIDAAADDVAEAYRGIGIRIEDDLLITEDGVENLTAAVPKTVEEIEAACQAS